MGARQCTVPQSTLTFRRLRKLPGASSFRPAALRRIARVPIMACVAQMPHSPLAYGCMGERPDARGQFVQLATIQEGRATLAQPLARREVDRVCVLAAAVAASAAAAARCGCATKVAVGVRQAARAADPRAGRGPVPPLEVDDHQRASLQQRVQSRNAHGRVDRGPDVRHQAAQSGLGLQVVQRLFPTRIIRYFNVLYHAAAEFASQLRSAMAGVATSHRPHPASETLRAARVLRVPPSAAHAISKTFHGDGRGRLGGQGASPVSEVISRGSRNAAYPKSRRDHDPVSVRNKECARFRFVPGNKYATCRRSARAREPCTLHLPGQLQAACCSCLGGLGKGCRFEYCSRCGSASASRVGQAGSSRSCLAEARLGPHQLCVPV
eukprot:363770-Chlamydomonas_euryale.AAC.8